VGRGGETSELVGVRRELRGKPTRIFHDLRRTGARNLVRAESLGGGVIALGEWKTRSVLDRYNILSERKLHNAASKLERPPAELAGVTAESTGEKGFKDHDGQRSTVPLVNC
jgi:hypothetical protein